MAKEDEAVKKIMDHKPAPTPKPADLHDLDAFEFQGVRNVVKSGGIGLRLAEWSALEDIGVQVGEVLHDDPIARNAILRLAARYLIADVRSGTITLEQLAQHFKPPPKKKSRRQFRP